MGFLNTALNVANTLNSGNRNVLSNVTQVTSGFTAVANNMASSLKQMAQLGQTNLGLPNALKAGFDPSTGAGEFGSNLFPGLTRNASQGFKLPEVNATDKGILDNELFDYSVYNYHFTLSVLSKGQYNNYSYVGGDLGQIILSSAGAAKEDDLVQTASGKLDYHIEDLRITSVAGLNESTGNTNALNLSFRIIEPYSMGLFFQALQVAALKQGYMNYADVPILLTIKFTGHHDPDNLNIESRISRKYIPLKIREIQMNVDRSGCNYDVEAYPYNEVGFSDSFVQVKTDIQIICDENVPKTVEQLLRKSEKSLKHVVNQWYKERVKQNTTKFYDEIDIVFPDESRNDESLNKMGASNLGFSNYNRGSNGFAEDNFVYEDGVYKRGKMKINPSNGVFTFDQGQLVTDIINQVILTSEYPKFALKNWTPQGQIRWWRVDVKHYFKGTEDPVTGYCPKKTVYRVEEYLVDAQKFTNVNTKNPGIENKWREVVKQYFYIYTGQNLDVLDLRLEFKTGFYKALTADQGKLSEGQQTAQAFGGSNQEHIGKEDAKTPEGSTKVEKVPSQAGLNVLKTRTSGKGSAFQQDDPVTLAARQFHDLVTTGYDMLNLNMTILGDPFYIVSSGTGNYRASHTARQSINGDREMDYESGEVYVAVYFRTPVDHNPSNRTNANWDGMYDFGPEDSQFQFSGLFRVLNIKSMFIKGKFTQELTLIRVPDQDNKGAEGKLLQSKNDAPGDDQQGPEGLTELEEADLAEIGLSEGAPEWQGSLEPTYEQEEYANELGDTDL